MSKTNKSTQPKQAAQAETVEAVEQADQAVVETTTEIEQADQADPADTSEPAAAGGYVVQWPIKLDGKRYGIGDEVDMTADQAAPFLASGAIAAKE